MALSTPEAATAVTSYLMSELAIRRASFSSSHRIRTLGELFGLTGGIRSLPVPGICAEQSHYNNGPKDRQINSFPLNPPDPSRVRMRQAD
jgi:hypothetical protein